MELFTTMATLGLKELLFFLCYCIHIATLHTQLSVTEQYNLMKQLLLVK